MENRDKTQNLIHKRNEIHHKEIGKDQQPEKPVDDRGYAHEKFHEGAQDFFYRCRGPFCQIDRGEDAERYGNDKSQRGQKDRIDQIDKDTVLVGIVIPDRRCNESNSRCFQYRGGGIDEKTDDHEDKERSGACNTKKDPFGQVDAFLHSIPFCPVIKKEKNWVYFILLMRYQRDRSCSFPGRCLRGSSWLDQPGWTGRS